MSSQEESRESGRAFMVIGWILVLFALMVVFFEPAALRLVESRFGIIAVVMVLAGVLLNIYGYRLRRRTL